MKEQPLAVQVSIRVPRELLKELDAMARQESRNRSSQIKHLLRLGIRSKTPQEARAGAVTGMEVAHG